MILIYQCEQNFHNTVFPIYSWEICYKIPQEYLKLSNIEPYIYCVSPLHMHAYDIRYMSYTVKNQ